MDMWKPFRNSTTRHAPQAAILFDTFHVLRHLGEALDKARKQEYAPLSGKGRAFIKGQKYAALGRHRRLLRSTEQGLSRIRRGLNNKIRVIQRRAYGLHDQEYLKLKVLTCVLPEL